MQTADDLDFGRFRLRPRQRLLLVDGVPAELGTRAVEVLLTLIEANGLPVSKDLIMRRVWPEAIVEENNLAVQVHALRAALGADRDLIRTIPRMGYCFTGQVTALDDAAQGDGTTPAKAPRQFPDHNLPAAFEELIGREAEQRELVKLLTECRLLTLAGPGGIGKTRLALDVARRVLPQFPDGVWFVDLPRSLARSLSPRQSRLRLACISVPLFDPPAKSRRHLSARGCCWCWTTANT